MQPLDNSLWVLKDILIVMALGFAFGWALDKGGMNRYHKIVNTFRLTDMAVLQFMMSALFTGMIGIYILHWMGEIDLTAITPTIPIKNFGGGLLFGVGMALAGLCPGTVIAGSGRGQLDYLIPGIGGFLTGAFLYGMLYPSITQFFIDLQNTTLGKNYGHAKLADLWDLNEQLLVYVLAMAFLLTLYMIHKLHLQRQDRLNKGAQGS